ncbi:hypothetical protein CMO84_08450 [Candidatus Woesearchaeota archaeon]|jgi:ABC-type Mn2+/Zn2+ transport system permease subunit|nr:hypothetical protein [Candidatus Woesearchaeota archaeon]MDP6740106.1 metal ABC transporter permease [Planctomycetota bacterium]
MSIQEAWEFFRWSILAILVAGATLPVIGAWLFVRRTSFHGLALPQFAASGVACGFMLLPWFVAQGMFGGLPLGEVAADTHTALNYHLSFAALGTFGGLSLLVLVGDRLGTEGARVAGAFAVASAITILCAHRSPLGEIFVHGILTGESLVVGIHEFETLAVVLLGGLGLLVWWHHDLVLVSMDSESAFVLGRPVKRIELLFMVVTGLSVSVGTMSVGPMILFGLLVLPPMGARPFARSMRGLLWKSAGFGTVGAMLGLFAAFRLDLPPSPCVVATSAVCALPGWLFAGWRSSTRSS